MVENGTLWTNRIHVQDLAAAITKAIILEKLPPLLLLSDGTPAQACDVVEFYCKLLQLPMPRSISYEEALAAKLETMLSNQRINSKQSWAVLGLEPKFPSYRTEWHGAKNVPL